ncbi:hypothetical protein BX600DRAFT_149255 [Xylariales sp. PMI_506]|nr:hypothetical protein BX600DRAFT_149255 [Xylariales sp. PMI_506]
MATLVRTLCLPSERQKGFLGLPREIRAFIYRLTLVESSIITKRHNGTCSYSPISRHTPEVPGFMASGTTGSFAHSRGRRRTICTCSKRQGLNLLQTNRQIHVEAAGVFWSSNIFTFKCTVDFAHCVGKNLRLDYRNLLQHISIIAVDQRYAAYPLETKPSPEALEILLECKSLRRLEIPVEVFETNVDWIEELQALAAGLESVKLARVLVYEYHISKKSQKNHRYYEWVEVFVFASHDIPLERIGPAFDAREFTRHYQYNFLVLLKQALTNQLMNSVGTNYGPETLLLTYGFHHAQTQPELLLRDGTIARPLVLGMPPSKETWARQILLRRQEDALWRAGEEKRTQQAIAQTRRKKLERIRNEKFKVIAANVSKKKAEREIWTKEQLERENQERMAKLQEREASIRESAETRKVERKRSHRGNGFVLKGTQGSR